MESFLQFLTWRHIPFRNRSKPGELWMACPFCGDAKMRLGLNIHKNLGRCFNCEWKAGQGAKEKVAFQISRERIEFRNDGGQASAKEVRAIDLPVGWFLLSDVDLGEDGVDAPALRYMLERGIQLGTLKKFLVGSTVDSETKQAHRVVFPVFYERNLFGYVGRSYAGKEPKYLNSEGTRAIWGLEPANGRLLVLTEGVIKSLAIYQAVENFVAGAVLGNVLTDFQIEQVSEAGFTKVAYIPDPGGPGIRGGIEILNQLAKAGFETFVPWPLPDKQADEYSVLELVSMLGSFVKWSDKTYIRARKELMEVEIRDGFF